MKKSKKKIISLASYNKKKIIWSKNLYNNKEIKSLSKKLFLKAYKKRISYLNTWMNEPILQTSDDIIALQEIIYKTKPEVIIECGVCWGGSILFYEHMAKITNIKKIIGIDTFIPKDLEKRIYKKVSKDKVVLIKGFTTENDVIDKVKKITKKYKNFLVHLDSDHTFQNVLNELNTYSKFLSKNNYIIVGDTIVNRIPTQKQWKRDWNKNNNPEIALKAFLKKNKDFKIDKKINFKQLITHNPLGYIYKNKNNDL